MASRSYLRLSQLSELKAAELKEEWARRYGAPAPVLSLELLRLKADRIELVLKPSALGQIDTPCWTWVIPCPARKPFREAKLQIGAASDANSSDPAIVALLAEAAETRDLIHGSPGLSINQVARREGRCRKQLTKLFRLSHLSPRIVEAIVDGKLDRMPNRRELLDADLPVAWDEQHLLFGLVSR